MSIDIIILSVGMILLLATIPIAFYYGKKLGIKEEKRKWEEDTTLDKIVEKIAVKIGEKIGPSATKEILREMRRSNDNLKRFPIEPDGFIVGGDELFQTMAFNSRIKTACHGEWPEQEFDAAIREKVLQRLKLSFDIHAIFEKAWPGREFDTEDSYALVLNALAVTIAFSERE